MRRLPLLAGLLALPAVPVLAASPAYAVANVICVGSPAGTCDTTAASISAAITMANGNAFDDTILVGPGTYSDGPYDLDGNVHALTLTGSGEGSTVLTLPETPSSVEYIVANAASVSDLTVQMQAASSSNDTALSLYNQSSADHVTVDGTGTSNATGIHASFATVTNSTIHMPSSLGIYGEGASTVSDTDITADTGFNHSGTGTPDTLSRITIRSTWHGVVLDSGTVEIDNSVIDLGSGGGTGLLAANYNASTTPKTIDADHVTIVGGGASSKGVQAYSWNLNALQTSTVMLANSIVRGPETSLVANADNNGSQGGPSVATVSVSHSDYETTGGTIGANGSGGVVDGGGNVSVDPAFVDAANGDVHLSPGSPVVDLGDSATSSSSLDRDSAPRVVDGDGDGTAVQDMGAYELQDTTAPDTTVTGGPAGPTRDTTPTFGFSSEPGATFECAVDAAAFAACSSPHTTAALSNGKHTFRVRATDAAANTDASPATRSFTVDTVAPDTTITSKPAKQITTRSARFRFTASEKGSTFRCRLDGGAWKTCTSPWTVRVKKGKHVFAVRARDAAGNVDPTPARYAFKRIR